MHIPITKRHIPWAMAATRAALGPVLIAGAACQWSGWTLAALVVTALVSDVYDGVLARRWHCDSAGVRLFDSMADTAFYLCAAVALWIVQPALWHRNAALLGVLLGLEAFRFVFDCRKFGKPASYHSWLAKSWGLALATAVVLVFAKGWSYPWVPMALALGVVCNFEGLAMSILLPVWCKDVKTICAALPLRRALQPASSDRPPIAHSRQHLLPKAIVICLACTLTLPLFAVEAGQVAYISGTSPTIAKDTLGMLDTASSTALIFRSSGSATAGDLVIPYKSITSFQYSTEVARHLGVLPAISVALVRRRERKHFFSINYLDASNAPQVAVFEVPKHDPRGLWAILHTRAPQAHGKDTSYDRAGFVP